MLLTLLLLTTRNSLGHRETKSASTEQCYLHITLCISVKNTGTAEMDKLYELSSKCEDLQRNVGSNSFDHKVSYNTQIGQSFYSKVCLLLILSYFFYNM